MQGKFTRKEFLKMLGILTCTSVMGSAVPATALAQTTERHGQTLGLHVNEGGLVTRENKPFRGIGVNYFDAFARTLLDPNDTSYRQGMQTLAEYNIPFARIMGCGYWPSDNRLYFDDKEEYFRRFADVVASAEEAGIGLIPSLFWADFTATDMMDESRNQWGNPRSRTHEFMREYTREVVTRFVNSPAIWGWEFGNEYNLDADLPNASDWRPPIVPEKGTRLHRDEHDDLTHEQIAVAFRAFAQQVREYDPYRLIEAGNAAPRPSAWHQREYLTWDQDTLSQFAEILLDTNPDPMDTISIHDYATSERRFGREVSIAEFLKDCMRVSRSSRKPLFVGEFGSNEAEGHGVAEAKFREILDAILEARVPIAALWVYDYSGQDGTSNVTATNNREYQLRAISEANERLRPAPVYKPRGN